MAIIDLDLSTIPSESLQGEYSEAQKLEIKENYLKVKKKFDSGEPLTLEDQKVIIDHARADREEKFILNKKTAKAPKERKAKKLSRAKLVLLLEKPEEDSTEDEVKDRDHSLALYKGRKISGKALNLILVAEARGEGINKLDQIDKNLAMYGSIEDVKD